MFYGSKVSRCSCCLVFNENPEEDNLLETLEFSYTRMTRTSAVLFIAASGETTIQNVKPLRSLSPNLLLTWDEESKEYLDSLKSHKFQSRKAF